jgi:hypothetical protein
MVFNIIFKVFVMYFSFIFCAFCVFVLFYVFFLLCAVLTNFDTSLPTTATWWKPNCSK